MKTVGEFKKAGLVFVIGDVVADDGNNDGSKMKPLPYWMVEHCNAGRYNYDHAKIESFAWRENTGVKPEFKGLIEVVFNRGGTCQDVVGSFRWSGSFNPIIKWRPSLNQPSVVELDTKESAIHKAWVALGGELINCENGHLDQTQSVLLIKKGELYCTTLNKSLSNAASNDGWELICTTQEFTSYCEKMAAEEKRMDIIGQNGNDGLHYDNTAQQVEALAVKQPSEKMKFALDEVDEISAKVINDKPIFTQSMADAYKMPAIGSWFTLHYYEHGSRFNDMDGHDFEVIGINDDIYTFRNDIKGYGALKLNTINCTPIDTRTDREKAIDEAMTDIDAERGDRASVAGVVERMIAAGYSKC